MRIFFATVIVMIIFSTAGAQTSSKISHVSEITLSKSETRHLLGRFQYEMTLSARGNEPMWPLLILIKARPVKELESLYIDKDKSIFGVLGGWSGWCYGIICRYVAPKHFCKLFLHELSNSDPIIRKFACEVLGEIGETKAIPGLKKLLNDNAVIPGYSDGSR